MQLGRSGEVRALAVPEIPQMQEARNFWRMRVEQAVISVCSFSVCAFVLLLNSWNREGQILCSAQNSRNASVFRRRVKSPPRQELEDRKGRGWGHRGRQQRQSWILSGSDTPFGGSLSAYADAYKLQPCLPSSSSSDPSCLSPSLQLVFWRRGLRRCVKSSSLFNFSNCHAEEGKEEERSSQLGCPKVKSQLSSLK